MLIHGKTPGINQPLAKIPVVMTKGRFPHNLRKVPRRYYAGNHKRQSRVNELSETACAKENAVLPEHEASRNILERRSQDFPSFNGHACARARAEIFPEMHGDLRKMSGNYARNISRELKFPLKNLLGART